MVASHLIGPVAQGYHQQLLTEAAHERRLLLAEGHGYPAPERRRSSAQGALAACQILAAARHVVAWAGLLPRQGTRLTAARRRTRGLAAVSGTAGGEHAERSAPFGPFSVG